MASAACAGDRRAPRRALVGERRAGSRETSVSVASTSAGVAIGRTTAVEPLLQERHEQLVRSSAARERRSSTSGARRGTAARTRLASGSGAVEDRAQRRPRAARRRRGARAARAVAALVRHADHRGVDIEHARRPSRATRLERRVEREALRERAGDLVQRAQTPRGLRARRRARASRSPPRRFVSSCSCAFWTATASWPASAREQRLLVLVEPAPRAGRPRAARSTRARATSGRASAASISASRQRRATPRAASRATSGDGDERRGRARAEREVEQPLRDARVRAGEPAAGRRLRAVRRRAGRRRRARRRGARRRARPRSRACARARARRSPGRSPRAARACARAPRGLRQRLARAERLRRAHREGREQARDAARRLGSSVEDELEDAERGLAEPDADDASRPRRPAPASRACPPRPARAPGCARWSTRPRLRAPASPSARAPEQPLRAPPASAASWASCRRVPPASASASPASASSRSRRAVAVAVRPEVGGEDERDLRRCRARRSEASSRANGSRGSEQLELADDRVPALDRDGQRGRRPVPRLSAGRARSDQLGGDDRGRRPNGSGGEIAARLLPETHHGRVRAQRLSNGFGERLERLRGVAHRSEVWTNRLNFPHGRAGEAPNGG